MQSNQQSIEIEFLGTGTSTGVPVVGCQCAVCKSTDARDSRMRSSALIRTEGKTILIDCGPDFRMQMLRATDYHLDAMIATHVHYDHVGGVDDLRPYCHRLGYFPIYARSEVLKDLRMKMPYSFGANPYPGAPRFQEHEVGDEPFCCEGVMVTPLPVWHGKLLINGYRIGDLAYITDAKTIDESTFERLAGVRLLVINGLRFKEHSTHFTIAEALEVIRRVNPEQAYITHLCHDAGFHADSEKILTEGVHFAYDGLVVRI